MLVILLSLLTGSAYAQDANDDGCLDAYEGNGSCVATSASIGPDVSIGAGVFIGSGATLVGRSGLSGARPVGVGSTIGRRTYIGADHDIADDNTIGRAVDIGVRFESETGVSMGYGTEVGDDVFVGAGATLGSLVDVGNESEVAANTVLARGVTIADSTSTAFIGGTVGPNVTIGPGANIATNARIRKDATLGEGVTVQSGARIGRDAVIEDGAVIGANARIAARATVTATTTVPNGVVVRAGETYDDPAPVTPSYGDWLVGTPCNGSGGSGGCTPQETGYHYKGEYQGYACWWHTKNQAWNTSTSTNFHSLAQHFGLSTTNGKSNWCHPFSGTPTPNSYGGPYMDPSNIGAWGWCGGTPFSSGGWVCLQLP